MGTILSIEAGGTRFLINGKPTFLLGASYYAGLGASGAFLEQDLADLRRHGFNWIRVWCTWAAFGRDVSAVDASGRAREPWMTSLKALCERTDRLGMVVDVTFSRGNGIVNSPLGSQEAHVRAARTVAEALVAFRNLYIDMANERNIRDRRHVTFEELGEIRRAIKAADPRRMVTASSADDIPPERVADYLKSAGVEFLAPHRPRNGASAGQTAARTREYLDRAQAVLGRPVPVHYQEPFRRDFDDRWQPAAADFLRDLRGSIEGGAAGWCFHNGDCRPREDGRPRRSFDLRSEEGRLFDQLDADERAVVEGAADVCRGEPRNRADPKMP